MFLRPPKPQLGVQIDVVVPGQPVDAIQLTVRQSHHLRETRRHVIDFVDHPFRSHDWYITGDLHRSNFLNFIV